MWQGANYNSTLSTKDIAKILRNQLKTDFPNAKWSIRTEFGKIYISLMEYDKQIVVGEYEDGVSINHYKIERIKKLTDEGKVLFIRARDLAQSYNYDDSDVMRDYSDFGFFLDLSIGRWDKPFKVVKK